MKSKYRFRHATAKRFVVVTLCCLGLASMGCQSPLSRTARSSWLPFGRLAGTNEATPTTEPEPEAEVASELQSASEANKVTTAGGSFLDNLTSPTKLVGYVTGNYSDVPKAKQSYQRGHQMFIEAETASVEERKKLFSKAAGFFKKAGNTSEGSALQQDALFMQGEAQFFSDDLTGARDTFEKLQKEFPRNRHSDRAAARLFSISRYWIETSKAGSDAWYKVNWTDKRRPAYDVKGHAVKVLDQIRYDDPTGKLADDATMAAAAEHIRNANFELADEFLTDLRETFTDSDHMFLAHLLGIECKLEVYRGPAYSGRVLEEAATLVKQTRRRFPDELRQERYADILARASAKITYHQAEKLEYRAEYRAKRGEYGAAREYYQRILRDHPDTPQGERAREVMAKIGGLPANPTPYLAFLTKVFPDSKQSTPLVTVEDLARQRAATPEPESPGQETPGQESPTQEEPGGTFFR